MPLLMIAYQGRLALVHYSDIGQRGIKLWVLDNAEKEEWLAEYFRAPDIIFNQEHKLKLSGVNDAGEFIYVPTSFLDSFCIWYFDPKKDSFRKVKFEGIADEEFRLVNGLGDRRFDTLVAFPNHMDSLISL